MSRIEGLVTGKKQGKQPKQIAQHALELRLSRFVGNGLHEDVDLTNYTGGPLQFKLHLGLDADFADQREAHKKRLQVRGTQTRQWSDEKGELVFDYHAEHKYRNQGEKGTAYLHRGLIVRIRDAGSTPAYEDEGITFSITLDPKASWHACVQMIPVQDGQPAEPLYTCGTFFGTTSNAFDSKRQAFLREATTLTVPGSETLAPVVARAISPGPGGPGGPPALRLRPGFAFLVAGGRRADLYRPVWPGHALHRSCLLLARRRSDARIPHQARRAARQMCRCLAR